MSSQPPKKRLRSDDTYYLIGPSNHQIVGAKLPSNRQILQVLLHNRNIVKLKPNEAAKLVFTETKVFWEKARIPISSDWYCANKINKLYDKWDSLRKSCNRNSQKQQKKRKRI